MAAHVDKSVSSPSPRPTPPVGSDSRPRTPGSASAVRDGRSLLAAFRNSKRERRGLGNPPATAAATVPPGNNRSSADPSSVQKSPSEQKKIDYVERYKSSAPGLARNLEAALDASLASRVSNTQGNTASTDNAEDKNDKDNDTQDDRVVVHGGDGGVGGGGASSKSANGADVEPASGEGFAAEGGESSDNEENGGGGERSGEGDAGEAGSNRPNGAAVRPPGDETDGADFDVGGGSGESSDGAASVATAASAAAAAATAAAAAVAAAADVATAVIKPSPPRHAANGGGSGSPAGLTPEMLREEARTSQAAFLSSVLPAEDLDFGASPSRSTPMQLSTPVTPDRLWSPAVDPAATPVLPPRHLTDGTAETAAVFTAAAGFDHSAVAVSSSDDKDSLAGLSLADRQAVGRWSSMRRLQEQSLGLGSAAHHQLTRALQLCRDARGLRGLGGETLSAHERASRLDALQSSLHGLGEVLSKRVIVDRAARREAEALGGPAILASLLGDGSDQGGEGAAATAAAAAADADMSGWLTGSQLKAFEKEVQGRSSIEISALESERRKLRGKVEMFQRQVQLLHREGAAHSPAAAAVNGGTSRIDTSTIGQGGSDTSGGPNSTAREKRFTELLNARVSEERHVQATLEKELESFRGRLEEKDGLISALREALRSAATQHPPTTPTQNGGAAATLDASGAENRMANGHRQQDITGTAESTPKPRSADGRAVVPGRGLFAPLSDESNRSHGRYHSRSSRLMGAQGPVAAAEAVARHTGAAPDRGPSSGRSSLQGGASKDGQAAAKDVRRVEVAPDDGYYDPVVLADDVSSQREASAAMAARDRSHDDRVVESAALSPPSSGAALGTRRNNTGVAPSKRASPNSLKRRKRNAYDDGYMDIISQATAVTGSALKNLWDSARVVGSRVGSKLDGGGGSEAPLRRGNSSHAVLIL